MKAVVKINDGIPGTTGITCIVYPYETNRMHINHYRMNVKPFRLFYVEDAHFETSHLIIVCFSNRFAVLENPKEEEILISFSFYKRLILYASSFFLYI